MDKLKTIWAWLSNNIKIVVIFIVIIVLSVFVFWWGRKNKKIRSLENQIAILNARLQIERLVIEYNTNIAGLQALKEKEKALNATLATIELSLGTKLKQDMTVDEIIAKFKEIGIR